MLDYLFREEFFPNLQSKPPLAQLVAVSSCPWFLFLTLQFSPYFPSAHQPVPKLRRAGETTVLHKIKPALNLLPPAVPPQSGCPPVARRRRRALRGSRHPRHPALPALRAPCPGCRASPPCLHTGGRFVLPTHAFVVYSWLCDTVKLASSAPGASPIDETPYKHFIFFFFS